MPAPAFLPGKFLTSSTRTTVDKIEALYHINGGAFQFTAHNFITQDNLKGTAVIHGIVMDGPLKGARVRGEYQVISPCGVINAQNGRAATCVTRALSPLG